MKPPSIAASRGARSLLGRLLWYGRRYGHIHPSQKKLGCKLLPSERSVSDRTVRAYLAELNKYVEVEQGGDGHNASYYFTPALIAALPSELTSGLLPGCFRAEKDMASQQPAPHQPVAAENFRAETAQSRSSCSSESSNQSECTVQEHREPTIAETEPSPNEKAQTDAIADAVRACGFEPTPDLVGKLERKRRFFGATGFRVAAAISRALKLVEGTSNEPNRQRPGWITVVVENALKADNLPPQRDTARPVEPCGGNAHTVTWETPAAHVAPVGDTHAAIVEPVATPGPRLVPKPAPPCPQCQDDGVRRDATDSGLYAWCDCSRGVERRALEPGYIEKQNAAVLKLRRLIRPIVPDVRKSSPSIPARGAGSTTPNGEADPRPTIQGFPHNRKAPGFQRAGELTGEIQARMGAHAGL